LKKISAGAAVDVLLAALTWPMLELDSITDKIIDTMLSFEEYHQPYSTRETDQYRTFMLIVACALDGGPLPEPRMLITKQQGKNIVDIWWKNEKGYDGLIQAVEQYHGIGAQE
jgi:hypothetical protein